jgi:O-antigen/teichoic acid export membrane protein
MFAGDIPAARFAQRSVSQDDRHRWYSEYVLAVAVAGILIAVLLVPVSGLIATDIWSSPGSAGLVALAIALVPISASRSAVTALQRLEGKPKSFAFLATVSLVAQLSLAVALVAMGLGPYGAILGFLGGNLLGLTLALAVTRDLLTTKVSFRRMTRLVVMGVPFLPAMVTFLAADYISRSIVAEDLGPAAVGAFGVSIRMASVLGLLSSAFQLAWGPRAIGLNPSPATARRFGQVLFSYTLVGGSACVILAAMGPEIVSIISGPAFVPAGAALPGLALGIVLAGGHYILSMGAGILARSWTAAGSAVMGATIQVVATILLVGPAGLAGVGIAAIVGHCVSVVSLAVRVSSVFDRRLWPAMGAFAGLAILCAALGMLNIDSQGTFPARVALAALSTFTLGIIGLRTARSVRDEVSRPLN